MKTEHYLLLFGFITNIVLVVVVAYSTISAGFFIF
jgi:hypothetical protein